MRAAALALRFASELAALAALAIAGIDALDGATGVILAVALPLAAATAWGRYVAPASTQRLKDPGRAAVELVIFTAATAGLLSAGHPILAVLLAITFAVTAPAARRYEPTPPAAA
jgi:hypothetical protein